LATVTGAAVSTAGGQVAGCRDAAFRPWSIAAEPLSRHPHLVAAPVAALVERLELGDIIGVFEIDPAISDTAATQARYDLDPASLPAWCQRINGRT